MSRWVVAVVLASLLAAGSPALAEDGAHATGRKVWDVLVLRPLGVVQVVAGAVVFPIAWPLAAAVDAATGADYADDVRVACIEGPVVQTFTRPLGE